MSGAPSHRNNHLQAAERIGHMLGKAVAGTAVEGLDDEEAAGSHKAGRQL